MRRKPIPLSSKVRRNRRLRPKEPKTSKCQVRLKTTRWEPTGVARPRPEPRTPKELAPMEFNPLGKDAKPSPARQFGPGTSGGRWQHRLPFWFWAPCLGTDDATSRPFPARLQPLRSSPGRSTGWIAPGNPSPDDLPMVAARSADGGGHEPSPNPLHHAAPHRDGQVRIAPRSEPAHPSPVPGRIDCDRLRQRTGLRT